jgi:beta-mannosidase
MTLRALVIPLLVAAALPARAQRLELTEGWTLRARHAAVGPVPVAVPGMIHPALRAAALIPDPFFGANEHAVAWVDTTTWVYARTVDVPATMQAPRLVFEGIDTFADVRVDGAAVLRSDNMFRRYRVPLTPGSHRVEVVIRPAVREAERRAAAYPQRLPESPRVFARKAQYSFGWDWGPRLVGGGLWKPVSLEDAAAPRLTDVVAVPVHIGGDAARYRLTGRLENVAEGARVRVRLDGQEVAAQRVGAGEFSVPIRIENPRLWWPRGQGTPHLYRLAVEVEGDGFTLRETKDLGVRTVALDRRGGAFAFVVNGVPVFARGANLVPMGSFLPEDRAVYATRMQDAADAGMNLLRVWGGGIYEDEALYEIADSLGLMLWQDFPFASAMYPGDPAFVANVRAEAEENVRRLRGHASLVLWCGGNEMREGWFNWGWQRALGYTPQDSLAVWRAYERLFDETLPAVVRRLAPHTPYWPSSPLHGWGRDVAYRDGDVHFWGVWWGQMPFEAYRAKVGRFNSEYGMQAYPAWATVRTFADTLSEANPAFRNHNKHPQGWTWLRNYALQTFGHAPDSLRRYSFLTQAMQAEGIGMAIAAHRAAKPHSMGTLYWQLNDVWPVVSWSSVDVFGRWKPLHYRARELYGTFFAEARTEADTVRVRLVSDSRGAFSGRLVAEAFSVRHGRVRADTLAVRLAPGEARTVALHARAALGAPDSLAAYRLRLVDERGVTRLDTRSTLASPWDVALEDPGLRVERRGDRLVLTAARVARGVWLEDDANGVHLPINYLDLWPGVPVAVPVPAGVSVTIRSLYDARRR